MPNTARLALKTLLALRGDIPKGAKKVNSDFAHANELIAFILQNEPSLCIAAACYPENISLPTHWNGISTMLLKKQDAGASFLMTQLCYSVENYLRFLEAARKRGVTLPIIAGILPILKPDGLVRMTLSNGCSIPKEVAALVGRYGEDEKAFRAAGHAYIVELVQKFMKRMLPGSISTR